MFCYCLLFDVFAGRLVVVVVVPLLVGLEGCLAVDNVVGGLFCGCEGSDCGF